MFQSCSFSNWWTDERFVYLSGCSIYIDMARIFLRCYFVWNGQRTPLYSSFLLPSKWKEKGSPLPGCQQYRPELYCFIFTWWHFKARRSGCFQTEFFLSAFSLALSLEASMLAREPNSMHFFPIYIYSKPFGCVIMLLFPTIFVLKVSI